MYNFVAHYVNHDGANVTYPMVDGLEMCDIMNDVKVGETVMVWKIDHEQVFEEFLSWLNSVTVEPWDIAEIEEREVRNWLRYQAVDFWKYEIVKTLVNDWK